MRPFLFIAELTTGQPETFAVVSVDPTERHEDGGCVGTIVSLHLSREDAEHSLGEEGA